MKLVVLLENTAACGCVVPQHGLSLYIETGGKKILFDMGQTDLFIRNAQALGVDLSQVDFAVVSHGHYDHGGGLRAFLELNPKAPVYIHNTAFGYYYNAAQKYIGLDHTLRNNDRLVFTDGQVQITPQILLTDCNAQKWSSCSYGLTKKEEDALRPDDFLHEQYLQIREAGKQFLISGCSHKGIVNIAQHFVPDVLVGGFHLNKVENVHLLEKTAQELLEIGAVYYTGHCTGESQYQVMKKIMGTHLHRISTGNVIEL